MTRLYNKEGNLLPEKFVQLGTNQGTYTIDNLNKYKEIVAFGWGYGWITIGRLNLTLIQNSHFPTESTVYEAGAADGYEIYFQKMGDNRIRVGHGGNISNIVVGLVY